MVLILAYPGDVYKGMLESEVAESYEELAMKAYDENILFSKAYEPFKDKPDFSMYYDKKGLPFTMTAFVDQDAEGFGSVHRPFVTSSYLFNPNHNGLVLPDLDAVHIASGTDSIDIMMEIAEFYKSFGWKVGWGKDIWTLQMPNDHPERFKKFGSIKIINPKNIVAAAKSIGYSDTELYFTQN